MPDFNLTDDDIQKLKRRFDLFQKEREIIHKLLNDYIVDYRQYSGRAAERYEYLREKYISQSPNLSHLIFNDGNILWSLNDIAIVLGRHLTSIIRTFYKIEFTEGYCAKLIALRETVKAKNGHNIPVYHKEIFDLIIDFYEYEYLLRFSEPRRGDKDNAPDINEIKRFWTYLKDFNNYNNYILEQQKHLPDIPPMNLKDILSLIWQKVFNIKIGTVCSVIFAVCFELVRRFLGINLWFAVIPFVISILCVFLIHKRKFKPDILSDIASGALLFTLLWISASLSVERFQYEPKKTEPKIYLNPVNYNEKLYFTINSNIVPNEYLYRISPDEKFSSTGFLPQINHDNGKYYPDLTIKNNKTDGIINLELKYLDDDKESKIWKFSFDIPAEKFKLDKKFILDYSKEAWLNVVPFFNYGENEQRIYAGITAVELNIILQTNESKNSVESIVYGINKDFPDTKINLLQTLEELKEKWWTDEFLRTEENDIDFVSSYLIFKDGSSSDIRISKKIIE